MFEQAKEYVLMQLRDAAKSGALPAKVALTIYKDDDTYKVFRPYEYMDGIASKHEGAMADLAVEISREFPRVWVYLVPLSLEEYEKWLANRGLKDSPETRAMYATESEKVRGEEIDFLKNGKDN